MLETHAELVMDGIEELIPEEFRRSFVPPEYEEYDFSIQTLSGEDLSSCIDEREALERIPPVDAPTR